MVRRLAALALLGGCLGGLARGADVVEFAAKVQPILAARCIKCHGADKQMGRLRLDTPQAIADSHKDTLVVAGKPDESTLLKRISLPADDKKRMPKGGDPLSAEEIALVREWIAQGASLTSAAAPATDGAGATAAAPARTPRTPGEDDPELAALPKASAEAIAKIEAAGATVMPLFADSPLLQVSFAQAASPPGDDAVAALAAAGDQIVWLNLRGAQVTAGGLVPLAKLKNLIQLHLENSTADDAGLASLAGAKRLEYLNLYGTTVTDAGLEPLRGLPKLRDLYVWKTKVSYDAAQAMQAAIPGLAVNLGWDHPQVMKMRLGKELESAKAIVETATTRAKELESQFNSARDARETAEKRVKEIEEQLKGLEAPAEQPKSEPASEQPAT
jgi:mono/diheme cytochrome c family protein